MVKQKVVISICTYKRPKMLLACLQSILSQTIPHDWSLEIHIIDNEEHSSLSSEMTHWDLPSTPKVRYFIEKNRGIPIARNTALHQATLHQADWLMFIDDDELANPNWLVAYAEGVNKFKADVYTGPVDYIYPNDTAQWLENEGGKNLQDGDIKKQAETNNVLISKNIFSTAGMNLTFDTQMAMTGGSDTDFFLRLVANGGKIVFVKNALVTEKVLTNRTTLLWFLKRQYRVSANRIYMCLKFNGIKKTLRFTIKESFRNVFQGTFGLICSPFYLFISKNMFKKRYYRSLRHFAKFAGTLFGLAGIRPAPYKVTDGC